MASKHLWEIKHPYYMQEGCYYARPSQGDVSHGDYESWQDFLAEWGNADEDYNHVFRWDWDRHDCDKWCDDECDQPKDVLKVYFIMQRKAYPFSTFTVVGPEDEPAIREYLRKRAEHVVALWNPFLNIASDQEN